MSLDSIIEQGLCYVFDTWRKANNQRRRMFDPSKWVVLPCPEYAPYPAGSYLLVSRRFLDEEVI